MDTFTWKPIVGTINPNIQALNRTVEFENGNAQFQQISTNAKKTWDFYIGGTFDEYESFISFFESHALGQQQFYWYDNFVSTQVQYTVVFNSDDFKPEVQYAYNEELNRFGAVGYKWKCSLRRVIET